MHATRNFAERFLGILLILLLTTAILLLPGCSKTPATTPESALASPANTPDPSFFPILKIPTPGIAQTEPSPAPVFEPEFYTHPDGLFSIPLPLGWAVESTSNTASLTNKEESAKVLIQVINTGIELDGESFKRFVLAREQNLFSSYSDYLESEQQIFTDSGTGSIQKHFTDQSVAITAQSWYYRVNAVVYSVDLRAKQEIFEQSARLVTELLKQLEFKDQSGASLEIYQDGDGYKYETVSCSLPLPSTWSAVHTSSDFTRVDTFTSPDQHAFVQSVVYDDGEAINRSVAGSFALLLLNSYYSQDLGINSDLVLADGREHLQWYSKSAGYTGDSYIETDGTTFMLFTTASDSGYEEMYAGLLGKLDETCHK